MSKTNGHKKIKLAAISPQRRNANRHSERGLGALESSIQKDGWIGAITVAADGETFDGSARIETGVAAGFEDAIVIESDGTKPIIHRRTDIPTADDPRAVRLGIAANRVAELNLDWNPEILADLAPEEIQGMFSDSELAALLDAAGKPTGLSDATPFASMGKTGAVQVRPVLAVNQAQVLERAIRATGNKNRAEALMVICESYLSEKGQHNSFSESELATILAQ